jgi:hypothetical protein
MKCLQHICSGTVTILALLLAACTPATDGPDKVDLLDKEQSGSPVIKSFSGLPRISNASHMCPEASELPEELTRAETLNDWVSGVHSVVVGRIAAINPVAVPFRQMQTVPVSVSWDREDCPGDILPALDLVLEDVETLYGAKSARVVVRVGMWAMTHWDAGPVKTNWNGVEVYSIVESEDPNYGIGIGTKIGFRLYESDRMPGVLSPAMTWLFEIDDEERIRVQSSKGHSSSCPGMPEFYTRQIDAVQNGLRLVELRQELKRLETQISYQPQEMETRIYTPENWAVGDGKHLVLFGAADCDYFVELDGEEVFVED